MSARDIWKRAHRAHADTVVAPRTRGACATVRVGPGESIRWCGLWPHFQGLIGAYFARGVQRGLHRC